MPIYIILCHIFVLEIKKLTLWCLKMQFTLRANVVY